MQIERTSGSPLKPTFEGTPGAQAARTGQTTGVDRTESAATAKTAEYALFGTTIEKALTAARGPEIAKSFSEEFLKQRTAGESPEAAARTAIATLEEQGKLSAPEAKALSDMIERLDALPPKEKKAQAAKALESLMEESEAAPSILRQLLDQDMGATGATGAPAGTPGKAGEAKGGGPASPKGPTTFINAPKGFLWKPMSDSTGKLAILLPPGMSGRVASVKVVGPSGSLIENGKNAGVGNGGREHFRFNKTGQEFPPGSKVEITLKTGQTVSYTIANPGIRNEGRA